MSDTIYYVAVGRDDAKQLFGSREPGPLRELLTGWIQSWSGSDQVLELSDASWSGLKDQLKAPSEEQQLAVTSLFEGNRPMPSGDGFSVAVVRPDAAGMVAHFLSEVDPVGDDAVQETQASLKKFFTGAVTARQAIAIVRSADTISG